MQSKTPLLLHFLYAWILFFILNLSINGKNINFIQHPIDLDFDGIHRIIAIDLDKDGDLDIIGGSEITPTTASKGVAWWRNEGNNTWTRFPISTNFIHIMSVDTADIDGDSFVDVVASSWSLHQIAWFKNPGDPTQIWTKYVVKYGLTNVHDVRCADIDNDGDMDVVATVSTPGSIQFCENDGSLSDWPTTAVTNSFAGALALFIADMDNDNFLDVIATASNANQVAWWKNNGGNPNTYPKKIIGLNFVGASGLDVVCMNNDSLLDIVSSAWKSSQVAYWLCNDIQNNSWTKYTVSTTLDTPAAVKCSDLDKDDDMDIVAVGKMPGELVVYENDNFNWNAILLQDKFYGGSAIDITDLDNDGDDDIIACASYIGELYWWENTLCTSPINERRINKITHFNLSQNFPNPFNPTTKIEFSIPKSLHVNLTIYDINGRLVKTLVNEQKKPGNYKIQWNAENQSSGIYYYKLTTRNYRSMKKCIFIR